jgi:hypothetical protein
MDLEWRALGDKGRRLLRRPESRAGLQSRELKFQGEQQLARFRRLLSRMDDRSRRLLLHMAQKMTTKAAESD